MARSSLRAAVQTNLPHRERGTCAYTAEAPYGGAIHPATLRHSPFDQGYCVHPTFCAVKSVWGVCTHRLHSGTMAVSSLKTSCSCVHSTLPLAEVPEDGAGWAAVRGTLQCEAPNADLHVFKGRFDLAPDGESCSVLHTPAPHTVAAMPGPFRVQVECSLVRTLERRHAHRRSPVQTRLASTCPL